MDSYIVVGKDTRISGDMLLHGIASGICSTGVNVYSAGILPTPAIAQLTAATGSKAGIMISASHNPYYDNGIKLFNNRGFKLSSDMEDEIEDLALKRNFYKNACKVQSIGTVFSLDDAKIIYKNFIKEIFNNGFSLKGMKIVIDCSNGASYRIAPEIFRDLGAQVHVLFDAPDGKNINDHCGSQHPEKMRKYVIEKGADTGFAFDGDGDRVIAVDENGSVITGDQCLIVCAKAMKAKGVLKNNIVVTTVMSNLGLKIALKDLEIDYVTSDVGDRNVMEKMIEAGAVLGGEDSGHTIFLDHHTTGDGILTALKLIEAVQLESKTLSESAGLMQIFPQVLINVKVKEKKDILLEPGIQKTIKTVEKKLGEKGRVLIRYSGTSPLLRIMVEGPTYEETRSLAQSIADSVSNSGLV